MSGRKRASTPRLKNPLVRSALGPGGNPAVGSLAAAFNTADVHSRRALLGIAAEFAGTVPADVARTLGQLHPNIEGPIGRMQREDAIQRLATRIRSRLQLLQEATASDYADAEFVVAGAAYIAQECLNDIDAIKAAATVYIGPNKVDA